MKQINWSDHILNFVAVIMGVSMAFYISSSSERQKEKRELTHILTSLIDELQEDRETFDEYQITSNENQSKALGDVLQRLVSGNTDSLELKFSNAITINNYHPFGVTFKSISYSGKLELIDDFELRTEISNYHELMASEAMLRGEAQYNFFMNQLMPWMIKNTSLVNPDVSKLVGNDELINILILYKSMLDNKLRSYYDLSEAAGTLEEKLNHLLSEE
ncbi:MAG: hypothetical protein RIM99_08105 [Cyclobacteriaceae bacterium]